MTDKRAHDFCIEQLFSLRDKTALVTGGTSGLGLAMAEGLLRNGARVLIASRKPSNCERALGQLSELGEVQALAADVSSSEGRASLQRFVRENYAGLNILINNAGTNFAAPIEDYDDAAFDKVIHTNLNSVFALTRDLLAELERGASAEEPARVINIGSMDGIHVPVVQRIPTFAYSASKAALHHLTRTLAVDLAPRHITVNAVAPGFFASKMTDFVFERYLTDIEADCPLGRIGKPEEIVGIVCYLASRAGAYTNGTTIPVDGGTSIAKGYRPWLDTESDE